MAGTHGGVANPRFYDLPGSDKAPHQYSMPWKAEGSVDQPQGKLDLAGSPCGPADNSKTAPLYRVGRDAKIHQIKSVEELRAELQNAQFTVAPFAKRRVLNQGEVEVVVLRSSEGVPPQRSKNSMIGARAAGHIDGNAEE